MFNWLYDLIFNHFNGSNTKELIQLLKNMCWFFGLAEFCRLYYECVLKGLPEGDPFLEKRIECCKNLNRRLDPTTNWKVPIADDEIRNGIRNCGGNVDIIIIVVPDNGGPPTPIPL